MKSLSIKILDEDGYLIDHRFFHKRKFRRWPVKVARKKAGNAKVEIRSARVLEWVHDLLDAVQLEVNVQGYYNLNHSTPEEISIIAKIIELWLVLRGVIVV